jgi:MFS family permease
MRLVDLRLHVAVRLTLYVFTALAWCTGVTFYSLRRWFQIDGEFGPQTHPWQQTVLSLHGGMVFVMLMLIGAIALNHIPNSWRSRRSRLTGCVMASGALGMAISGWGLYYLSDESWRSVVALVHCWMGLLLPAALCLHVLLGRRSRRRALLN